MGRRRIATILYLIGGAGPTKRRCSPGMLGVGLGCSLSKISPLKTKDQQWTSVVVCQRQVNDHSVETRTRVLTHARKVSLSCSPEN
eukprot:scaffold12038_cov149-Ochromonas_danica.AAC.1